uniref:SH2 domain-containing protein n=1 Tax=Mesocestoides corti TaxID=53468 RepID=A0A5K3FFW3_MESCO
MPLFSDANPGSVRSACSTNENDETTSIYSEESSGFRQGSDSGTVISCPLEVPQSSPSMLDEEFSNPTDADECARLVKPPQWGTQYVSTGSRLDHVMDRIFVQVSPEGDIKINHLACLAHIRTVIRKIVNEAKVLVFNCQEPDPNVAQLFDQVIDCCFDLRATPDLESFVRFCEVCYDWLAQSNSNVVLFHAESSTANHRLLLLLYAYASFCDSVERQNIRTNQRLKAYLSAYPNGNIRVPIVYLRYASYMTIFTPFRRQSISRATMSIHALTVANCPLFFDHRVSVFFKFYSYAPLRHVYTSNVHEIHGRTHNRAIIQFSEAAISLRGPVIIICYRWNPRQVERKRIFKLTFHSCEAHRECLTFDYDTFDEISEAVPATFKLSLHLTPLMEIDSGHENIFLEDTNTTRIRDAQIPLVNCIDPLNVIQSRSVSLQAVRLADSLEDLDYVPNRSNLLVERHDAEECRDLQRQRAQTFNEFFLKKYGLSERKKWNFHVASAFPQRSVEAPRRPPPPTFLSSVETLSAVTITSDKSSFDSGTSLHSDSSEGSESSRKRWKMSGLKKIKRKLKGAVEMARSSKSWKSLNDEASMPPPPSAVVPRAKTAPKSVAFHQATPKKEPPPRPPPPSSSAAANSMDSEEGVRVLKAPAGQRGVPTSYFGPLEKYRRTAESESTAVRGVCFHRAERSTPTILEDQEAEDFEEAEYRQLSREGYRFQHLPHHEMSTTQDLDQLLDELRRTSLDYSTGRLPSSINGHASRAHGGGGVSGPGRYTARSYSLTGANQRQSSVGGTAGTKWTSYQRSQAFSSERSQISGPTTPTFVRNATPAPQTPGQQRYQTTFRTTLQHRPPLSPKRFNQINVTIDPEFGTTSSSMVADNRGFLSPPTMSRPPQPPSSPLAASAVPVAMEKGSETISYRELQLLEELSSARQELAMLKRASSVIDEPLHKPPTPSTLPTQRRAYQHRENMEVFTNRQYQSHHDTQQGSSVYRPHGRYEGLNSGFVLGTPKRAMSSANITSSQSWNYRNGVMSGTQSPTPGYSSMRSTAGYLTPKSQGYSARRERLRQEAEHAEALRQSTQRMNYVAASSSDLRASSSLRQQRRQQHYHSMSTIQPERTGFEEVETVTLQPIGRGVQDLDSNMGSTATLNRPRRPVASSMLEGLNRMDNYTVTRQPRTNMAPFGRQASAVDVNQSINARPQHAASNSFLSSLRRQSAGGMSDTAGYHHHHQQQQQQLFTSTTTTNTSTNKTATVVHNDGPKFVSQPQLSQTVVPSLERSQQDSEASTLVGGTVDLAQVEATSPIWYRLKLSRQEAISILKNQPPGSFLVRDSTTFKDAYGLAVKSTKPPNKANQKSGFAKFMKNILNDINNDLVRHYLIETVTTPTRGVRIKGFSAERVFPNLLALIHYHTQFPVALPCCLVLPPVPPSQTSGAVLASNASSIVGNGGGGGGGGGGGDSDSVTLVQNNGSRSKDQTPVSFHSMNETGNGTDTHPARNITSPISPTAGMFPSGLASPPPNISCRCLYLGAVEVDATLKEAGLMQAVDALIPGAVLQAEVCDQGGVDCPVQYTECQLQAAHNEGILLTDLSRKLFFQRHFSASSFVYAGVDPRDKVFIHPNHSALGLDKPKLFGFIIKKMSGEYVGHVFSEFDANIPAANVTAQINSLLLSK